MNPTRKRIKANKQESDDKMMKLTENLKSIIASSITSMMDQEKTFKYSPTQKCQPNTPEHNTVIPANKRAPPLEGRNSTKNGGMWTLKHEISSPKLYELLVKI